MHRAIQSLALLLLLTASRLAIATTLNIPADADWVTLPRGLSACGPAPEGWQIDATRRRLKPLARRERLGTATELPAAAQQSACAGRGVETLTLILTGAPPIVEPTALELYSDQGRLEVRGSGLDGARVFWKAGQRQGDDTCLGIASDKGREACSISLPKDLPASPGAIRVRFAPAGGRFSEDAVTFDRGGREVNPDLQTMTPARLLVARVLPIGRTLDLSSGTGRIPLVRPEAVGAVDCAPARCELADGAVLVQAVPGDARNISLHLRLAPRVQLLREGTIGANALTESFDVIRCPMSIASGAPLRNVDDARVLIHLDATCGKEAERLRWRANRHIAELEQIERLRDGVFLLLRVGRIGEEKLTITASRPEPDDSVVGAVTEVTQELPVLHSRLVLPGLGPVEFIPTNRYAVLQLPSVAGPGRFVPVAVAGAYKVEHSGNEYRIRGETNSGAYTSLRYGWRPANIPEPFVRADFGIVTETVQRAIRQSNTAVALGTGKPANQRVVELLCATAPRRVESLEPGTSPHVPFSQRDSCRLVLHRSRIPAENGDQRLDIDITVTKAGGGTRDEGKQSLSLVVAHAERDDVIWITGVREQFDRVVVRVTQVIDESLSLAGSSARVNLPGAQWSVVMEDARFRFYATAALPTSLYRFSSDPGDLGTGPLALNFGVLSRLTWLDSEGRDGIVGIEAGMMGMGLATDKDRQLAAVMGIGLSVPLGNRGQPTQASVNIHAWASFTLGNRTADRTLGSGATETVTLNPWAFVVGPSITIGNVGTVL